MASMLAIWFTTENKPSEKTNTLLFKSCVSMMDHVLDMVPIVVMVVIAFRLFLLSDKKYCHVSSTNTPDDFSSRHVY